MAFAEDKNFARVVTTAPGRVELAFELDSERWPWQSLAPQHPVLLDMYLYFGPLTALLALDMARPEVQTALTWLAWQCDELASPALATRGVCTFPNYEDRDPRFELVLWTDTGERLVTASGGGVEFATRDFAAWRAKTKTEARDAGDQPPVRLASASDIGLEPGWIPLVSRIEEHSSERIVRAIVSRTEALPPAHPFHDGSGDHVNVGHLHDCALQAARLVRGTSIRCVGGDARFHRYVEMDVPFELRVLEDEGDSVRFACTQLGHGCAELGLTVRPAIR